MILSISSMQHDKNHLVIRQAWGHFDARQVVINQKPYLFQPFTFPIIKKIHFKQMLKLKDETV